MYSCSWLASLLDLVKSFNNSIFVQMKLHPVLNVCTIQEILCTYWVLLTSIYIIYTVYMCFKTNGEQSAVFLIVLHTKLTLLLNISSESSWNPIHLYYINSKCPVLSGVVQYYWDLSNNIQWPVSVKLNRDTQLFTHRVCLL